MVNIQDIVVQSELFNLVNFFELIKDSSEIVKYCIVGVVTAWVGWYFARKQAAAAAKKDNAEADSIRLKDVIELRKYNKEQIDELIKDNEETKELLKKAHTLIDELTKQSNELQRKVNIYRNIINARE
jgi:long-subunit acyl-CoA synthetase (AMP-forming)